MESEADWRVGRVEDHSRGPERSPPRVVIHQSRRAANKWRREKGEKEADR